MAIFPINNETELYAAMTRMYGIDLASFSKPSLYHTTGRPKYTLEYLEGIRRLPDEMPTGDRLKMWTNIVLWTMAIEGRKGKPIVGDRGGVTDQGLAINLLPVGDFRQKVIDGTATTEEKVAFYIRRYVHELYNLDHIRSEIACFYAFNEAIWGRTHLQTNIVDYFVAERGLLYGMRPPRKYPNKYQRLALLRDVTDAEMVAFIHWALERVEKQAVELKALWNTIPAKDGKGGVLRNADGSVVTLNQGVSVKAIARRYYQVLNGALSRMDQKPPIVASNTIDWRKMELFVENLKEGMA